MSEYKNVFSESGSNKNTYLEKTKKFTIELLILNHIYDKDSKNSEESIDTTESFDSIDKEKIVINIPINCKEDEFYFEINELKKILKKKGYPITTSKLFIYIEENINDYIFINDDKETINSSQLSKNDIIKLKLENNINKKLINNTFDLLKKHFLNIQEEKTENNTENVQSIEFNKRNRKIGEIIKYVYAQRKLFNGYYNDEGEKKKLNLDEASKAVGMKKKTLDEHLKQIRMARENGFDFYKNKDEPISTLRDFNKKHKDIKDKNNEDKKD